jgi:hypothetical protein
VMRFLYRRYWILSDHSTTGGMKQMATHSRPDNGLNAWVVLCVNPIHTDTGTYHL